MGRKFSTSTPRIYGLRHQCLALPELQSRLVFQPSSPHNSSSSRPSLLLPEIKWPLVPPAVIQDSNSGRGQEVSLETNAPLDVFRWPTMASSPTPVASEPSQQTSQQEPTPDTPDLYMLLAALGENDFRPRLEGYRTQTNKLMISYCGNRTTFEIEGVWKSLTVYHVNDIPASMIKRRALNAVQAGKAEVEC